MRPDVRINPSAAEVKNWLPPVISHRGETPSTWERLNSDFNINALLAELDGQVVGFTHYIFRPSTWEVEDFCYLEDLYTDPKVRGKGVGRALIKAVEEIAIASGSKRLYWTTAPDNETARKLYDKVAITDRVQYKIYLNQ